MIISIGGTFGSGKSNIARRLAEKLGWPYYDIGQLRRKFAAERGMTLEEYNKLGESDPSTDTDVDNYQAELGRSQDNFIIAGRTSYHFIPHSIKLFIKARPEVGAKRVFQSLAGRNEARNLQTIEDVLQSNLRRIESDRLRYKKYFNIEVFDESQYDHVIDTSDMSEEESFKAVCDILEL